MDPEDLLALPFDLYERYAFTRRVARTVWGNEEGLRVLDVGGNSSPLKQFLPGHEVFLTDIEPPGSLTSVPLLHDGYVQGSGAALPFPDGSFDLVTAHDTLEHIPPDLREDFLREVLRVSNGLVILNQPMHDPLTERAEARLLEFLRTLRDEESRFLREHVELGLPKTEMVEAFLDRSGTTYVGVANGNLALWAATNALKNYAQTLPDGGETAGRIDRTFNLVLADRDHAEPSYRRAYIVATRQELAERIRDLAPAIQPPDAERSRRDFEAVESLMGTLEAHGVGLKDLLRQYHEAVTLLRQDVLDRDKEVRDRELVVEDLEAVLVGKAEQIGEKDRAIVRRDRLVLERDAAIAAYESRWGVRASNRLRRWRERLVPPGSRRRGAMAVLRKGGATLTREGPIAFLRWLVSVWRWVPALFRHPPQPPRARVRPEGWETDDYQLWLDEHQLSPADLVAQRDEGERFAYRPRISVVMPVYNSEPGWLREAIDSVRSQTYTNWQLCIADDGSTRQDTREELERSRKRDRRIRVTTLPENRGISAASNAALALATGDFVALLDHDDVLQPDALQEVIRALNEQRDLDYIYSDEDKLELDGTHSQPFFKPDWSPDLLLSLNYVTHLSVFRRELVERVGGFREGFEGAQDWDLILRATEQTDRIAHIPKLLYSWRKAPGSAAASEEAKPYAYLAAKKAIEEAIARRGMDGEVRQGVVLGYFDVRYRIRGAPSVAIVIPTRDRLDMLRPCIESIRERSTYKSYEIVIVDNDSAEPETLAYLDEFSGRVIKQPGAFNFARIMNGAVGELDAEHVLLLNNDTEIGSDDWIEALLEHSQRAEVAAVGARLLFPDGEPQHEGVLVGPGDGLAGNIDTHRYFELGRTIRDCSAVTAACMMTRTDVFRELGGFEERLGVAYQDVDYCLRAREKGYLVVYTPLAVVTHVEGGTRGRTGRTHPEADESFFRERWRGYRDPYYNPSFDIDRPYRLKVGGPSA